MSIDMKEISRDDNQISFEINPIRGGLAIRDATVYAFTPFGFPDEKVRILNSEKKGRNLILSIASENSKNRILKKPNSITLFNKKILNDISQKNTLIGPCIIDDDNLYLAINNTLKMFYSR